MTDALVIALPVVVLDVFMQSSIVTHTYYSKARTMAAIELHVRKRLHTRSLTRISLAHAHEFCHDGNGGIMVKQLRCSFNETHVMEPSDAWVARTPPCPGTLMIAHS